MSTCFLRRQSARYPATSRGRRGFTLVEMLIAMVLTLIMVYAIAEFYAYVGEAVKDGRAVIEMRGGLRTATQRLKADLTLMTVKMDPPVEDAAAQGYFALQEGVCNDAAPIYDAVTVTNSGQIDIDGNGVPDIGQDTTPGGPDGIVDYLDVGINATNLLGDVDDWLGFTARSDVDPFTAPAALLNVNTGIFTGTGMETSTVAEIVWFTSFTDNPTFPNTGNWDPGETRTLHRRLLLVRPDVNLIHSGDTDYVDGTGQPAGPYYVRVPGTDVARAYYELMQVSDVSVRPLVVDNDYVVLGNPPHVYFTANSLADLTRRENRFMNVRHPLGNPTPVFAFPNALDLNPHYAGDPGASPWISPNNDGALFRWVLADPRRGEDIVLSNVLAFDLRVYDPTATLLLGHPDPAVAADVILQPGDPGYNIAKTANVADPLDYSQIGQGAFVDLNYSRYTAGPWTAPWASFYSGAPTLKSQMGAAGVYDSWAASYERDGYDQDGDGAFDEGTDGLDTDSRNGVDDSADNVTATTLLGENETLPPYPQPLRGIEVRVRIYEPGSRQAQQATVSADFVPE